MNESDLSKLSQPELVDFIVDRFHEGHRRDLPEIIALAERVESVHFDHEQAPRGLAELAKAALAELQTHMNKEEMVLFALIKNAPDARPEGPISVMTAEHDEHLRVIEAMSKKTNGFAPPEGACGSWRTLYAKLSHFANELKLHIDIENNILFPRALNSDS